MNNTKHTIPPVPEGFELVTAGTLQAGDIFLIPASATAGAWSNTFSPEAAELLCAFLEGAETTIDPRVGLAADSHYVYAARPVVKTTTNVPAAPSGYELVTSGLVQKGDRVLLNPYCCSAGLEAPEWDEAAGAIGHPVAKCLSDTLATLSVWYTVRPVAKKAPVTPETPKGHRIVKTGLVRKGDKVRIGSSWKPALGAIGDPAGLWYTARPTKRKTRSRK